ncbi:hypothetical protein JCM10213_007102 [Rhodosporidiobolus nylandii]
MRPSPGLLINAREAASRVTAPISKGGASKLHRPALKFQRPFHPPTAAAHPRAHSSSAASSWRSAFETVYNGVFRSIRSAATPRPGPYSGSGLAPHPSSTSPFPSFSRAAHTRAAAPRARFGPTLRPVVQRSTASSVGLGAARNFSSSGFGVFDNVVHNAPLALRALSGQGIDERKWKKTSMEIRQKSRTDVKGKGRVDPLAAAKEKRNEFALYFGGAPGAPASVEAEAAEPVVLTLAVDPDVDLPVASSSSSLDPAYERLVTPSLLHSFSAITSAYSSHSHRLRAIINRLQHAGLLDDEIGATSGLAVDPFTGRRIWQVVFCDGLVTRSRVERVIRGESWSALSENGEEGEVEVGWDAKVRRWSCSTGAATGEGVWWWLSGGSPSASSVAAPFDSPAFSPSASSPSSMSEASERNLSSEDEDLSCGIDAAYALAVAETFVLPDPSSSLLSSPSSSSSLSYAYSPPPVPAPASDETEAWDAFSLHLSASPTDVEQDELDVDPASVLWEAQASGAEDSASEWEYETGVRTLGEVEAERERRREWGFP